MLDAERTMDRSALARQPGRAAPNHRDAQCADVRCPTSPMPRRANDDASSKRVSSPGKVCPSVGGGRGRMPPR